MSDSPTSTPDLTALTRFTPPDSWTRITTIDLHTGGEPLRVITGGLPPNPGRTVLEKRAHFREHLDHLRTGLMWEPRGHADMYGAVLSANADDLGDFDAFFLHNEGYSTMCGHAILALTKLVIESGAVPAGQTEVVFLVPAGRIVAQGVVEDGVVVESRFRNVPSFVLHRDVEIEVTGLGRVKLDVAYGGAFYVIVEAAPLGLALTPNCVGDLIDAGQRIKRAAAKALPILHPGEAELSFLYGTIFTGPAQTKGRHSRNVCVFADGEVDRSATGSGVSARIALHVARGEVAMNEAIEIESIVGSTMRVAAVEATTFGIHDAVIPEVRGRAHYAGKHEFWFEPADPLAKGFLVR